MRIPLNTLTVSLFDLCLITRANLPALEPEVPAIPSRHKKPWIRTKVDLSFLADPGRLRALVGCAVCCGNAHFCSRRRQTIR
jgi:hypothetical protein